MAAAKASRARSGKPNKSKLQGEQSRAQILDAAGRLFSTRGYAGTTISQLSKDARLPVSSIYWHFDSKAGLLWAVAERGATAFLEALPSVSELQGEAIDRFEQMLQAIVKNEKNLEFLRLLMILILEHEDNPGAAGATKHVRDIALERWREAMRAIFAPDGNSEGVKYADEVAGLVRAVAMGAFITAEAEEDRGRFLEMLLVFGSLVRTRAELPVANARG